MNWYKKAQQSLMFYPFGGSPDTQKIRVNPIGIDPETKQNIYSCSLCKKSILEEDVDEWYKEGGDKPGQSQQLPPYDKNEITQALQEIAQYLLPFYNQLQTYIQEQNLESKRNETYDYGFDNALYGWEVQVPQLPIILNKYQLVKPLVLL